MFNRLQIVGNLFGGRQQNYHVEGDTVRINCMLCEGYVRERVFGGSFKRVKREMARQLVIHMYG